MFNYKGYTVYGKDVSRNALDQIVEVANAIAAKGYNVDYIEACGDMPVAHTYITTDNEGPYEVQAYSLDTYRNNGIPFNYISL